MPLTGARRSGVPTAWTSCHRLMTYDPAPEAAAGFSGGAEMPPLSRGVASMLVSLRVKVPWLFQTRNNSSDSDEYIPNGAFIIALAMAGCTLKRVNSDSPNAKSSAWQSHEATTRMAFSHELVGAREKLADPSTVQRNVLQAFAQAATGTDIAARPGFWEWVCERRAQDNPRGDFVRDARAVREGRNGAERWHEACLLRLAVACAFRPWNPDVVRPMPAFKHWARRYIAELCKE